MRWRWWATLGVLAVALGFVTTLGVAWGASMCSSTSNLELAQVFEAPEDDGYFSLFSCKSLWSTRRDWSYISPEDRLMDLEVSPRPRLPGGDAYPEWHFLVDQAAHGMQYFEARWDGWPLRCLSHSCRRDRGLKPWVWSGAIRFRTPILSHQRGVTDVRLSYRPIWLGLVGDVGLYALCWLVVLAAAPLTRHVLRMRRGRCVACGYDMSGGTGHTCPECGRDR